MKIRRRKKNISISSPSALCAKELERLPGPKVSPELIDFFLYLLVIDHTKRPTALEALQHPYLQLDSQRSIVDST